MVAQQVVHEFETGWKIRAGDELFGYEPNKGEEQERHIK
jgi:hypothetical protein